SWVEFQKWRATEERKYCIELLLVTTFLGLPEYKRQCRYVCSRGSTGGVKTYEKLHPKWNRKRERKRTDCKCVLTVKEYPEVATVLGSYSSEHNHPTGNANLPYVQIPKETREYIAGLLRQKIDPTHILAIIHGGVYDQDDLFEHDETVNAELIKLRDIRRIEKEIEAESVRLHPDDGESTLKWVKILHAKGHLLGFKSRTDPPPRGSDLPPDLFLLMIQTEWQRRMFANYGEALMCIDATHNVS
ncbi:hypothetical protein DFH07DRAFT_725469, partial [Mycena maculata]